MEQDNVLILCPREAVSVEPVTVSVERDGRILLAEDAVEELVVCLAAIEAAWSAGEFKRLKTCLQQVTGIADRAGMVDVAQVADAAAALVQRSDDVALAAVVARLVRVGECSLATLLEISYRQI